MKILKIIWRILSITLGVFLIGGGLMNVMELTKATSGIEALEYILAIALSFFLGYYLIKKKKNEEKTEANNG
jgi:hypothetical protein